MAKDRARAEMTDKGFAILSQIFGAFANGADTALVDHEAILRARDDYRTLAEEYADRWPKFEIAVLGAAHLMGRIAAQSALSRAAGGGSPRVSVQDYEAGRDSIAKETICPFRHPHE